MLPFPRRYFRVVSISTYKKQKASASVCSFLVVYRSTLNQSENFISEKNPLLGCGGLGSKVIKTGLGSDHSLINLLLIFK